MENLLQKNIDKYYKIIEAEAKKYGGEWGGRWNFYDSPHFQFRFGKTWEVYLKEYNAVGKK